MNSHSRGIALGVGMWFFGGAHPGAANGGSLATASRPGALLQGAAGFFALACCGIMAVGANLFAL